MENHMQCHSCSSELRQADVERGAAVYALGSWHCRECCADGSFAGEFLADPAAAGQLGDLAPKVPSDLQKKNKLLIQEVKRLRLVVEEAEAEHATASEAQARALRAEIDEAKAEAQAVRAELAALAEERADEATRSSEAKDEALAALAAELEGARQELASMSVSSEPPASAEEPVNVVPLEEPSAGGERGDAAPTDGSSEEPAANKPESPQAAAGGRKLLIGCVIAAAVSLFLLIAGAVALLLWVD